VIPIKDAYYFPHDSNAKDDPKCVLLIEQLGLEGYGIFWVLVETLREQPEYKYPLALLPALARRYNTTHDKMKVVVYNYGLFNIENDEFFFSETLRRRMEQIDYKRELARIAGKKSAEKRLLLNDRSTTVQPTFNDRSTSKVNKSKVNNNTSNSNINNNNNNIYNNMVPQDKPEGHTDVIAYFVEKYQECYHTKYLFSKEKDGVAVKRLLQTYDVKTIKELIDIYFDLYDEYVENNGRTISHFAASNTIAKCQAVAKKQKSRMATGGLLSW